MEDVKLAPHVFNETNELRKGIFHLLRGIRTDQFLHSTKEYVTIYGDKKSLRVNLNKIIFPLGLKVVDCPLPEK